MDKSYELDIKGEKEIKVKKIIDSKNTIDLAFLGDVKYSERESSDIALIGFITDLNEKLLKEDKSIYKNSFLVKWFQWRNSFFIDFNKWSDINIVQDYLTYPNAVNDQLLSKKEIGDLKKQQNKKVRDGTVKIDYDTNYSRLKDKLRDNFQQVIRGWVNYVNDITLELQKEYNVQNINEICSRTDTIGGIYVPILIFGNNPKLYITDMDDFYSKENEDSLNEVPFFILQMQIPSKLLRDISPSLKVGLTIPIVITTLENLERTIKIIENNLINAKFS